MSIMKNDLTPFEKQLLRAINWRHNTKYTYRHLMEWSNVKEVVEKKLKPDEKMYNECGVYVAIKEG